MGGTREERTKAEGEELRARRRPGGAGQGPRESAPEAHLPSAAEVDALRDSRLAHPSNDRLKAQVVLGLQQTRGNAYIERLAQGLDPLESAGADHPSTRRDQAARADLLSARQDQAVGADLLSARQAHAVGPDLVSARQGPQQDTAVGADLVSARQGLHQNDEETPVSPDMARRIEAAKGGGRPLAPAARGSVESVLAGDLGDVRLHTGPEADLLAREVQAEAFTSGADIFFRQEAYAPGTTKGEAVLAHELAHVAEQRGGSRASLQAASASTVVRLPEGVATAPKPASEAKPAAAPKPLDAAAIISSRYPHLGRALSADQMGRIQQVLEARTAIQRLKEEMRPYEGSILSEDVRKREALEARIRDQFEAMRKAGQDLTVATELLLAEDVLEGRLAPPAAKEAGSKEGAKEEEAKKGAAQVAFLQGLYKQLISYPTRLVVQPEAAGDAFYPFLRLYWGPYGWEMYHEGGLIGFKHLMRIEKFNVAYQAVLAGEAARLGEEMLELRRSMGGKLYDMMDKKLGEIYGRVWNTDVKVGLELGELGGYYDDPRGQAQMYFAMSRAKGAKVVFKAPDNFLHFFALRPSLDRQDLNKSKEGDNVWLLDKGRQTPEPFLIHTKDGFTLERDAKGWRCPADPSALSSIEQFAVGAFFGDAIEDPSVDMVIGQIFVGLIPIVGQIADARDVAIGVHKMWTTGTKEGKLQTAMALLGFLPGLGDAVKTAKKAGARAVKETLEAATPRVQRQLARRITENSVEAAALFGLTKAELKAARESFEKMTQLALTEGGDAATKYAKVMAENLSTLKGNAGAMVAMAGGKWADVAKALARDAGAEGKKVLDAMQAWRKEQFDLLESGLKKDAKEFALPTGGKLEYEPPRRTGTDSPLSDLDINFLGPDAVQLRNLATHRLYEKFGPKWKDILDADVFAEPRRMHLFEEAAAGLGEKGARALEKQVLEESKLNVLAKMLKEGVGDAEVHRFAKAMGIDMAEVAARRDEIVKLAGNPALLRQTELKMDVLHAQFLKETDPVKKAAIAKEMAITQGKLNAAVKEGPYITAGSVEARVTRAEDIGGVRAGPYAPMSPIMGYSSALGDLAMLKLTMKEMAGGVLKPGKAKAWAKYADRLVVTVGQYGIDFSKAMGARKLFDTIDGLLAAARKDPTRLLSEAGRYFDDAFAALDRQLEFLLAVVEENAARYLESGVKVERSAVDKALTGAKKALTDQQTLVSEASNLARYELRKEEAKRKEEAAAKGK